MVWLPLYALVFIVLTLYWARAAALANGNHETWFSARHSLPGWMSAILIAGASLGGLAVLVVPQTLASNSFGMPALLQAGVLLALPGVVFFKRIWLIGQRLRLSSLSELLRVYYRSQFLAIVSALVAVLFAVCFAGLQIRALGSVAAGLSDGALPLEAVSLIFAFVLVGYVVIGGMRAIGYLGTIQSVLGIAALMGITVFAILSIGGIGVLNEGLQALGSDPATSALFAVSGVIQFTAGLGREAAAGHEGTVVANLSLAFALLGMQASPVILKVVLSTSSARAIAAGQTWVLAGAFGALVVLFAGALGAAGLVAPNLTVGPLLSAISPWFSAWAFVGASCAVMVLAGLSLFVAAEALVRTLYKPNFHRSLSTKGTVALARIAVVVLALVSVLMQALTPVTLSALAALALPLAFQLWVPLLGMTWVHWFTRSAVLAGMGFGIAGVLLTDVAGLAILSFLGLDLPWGRWPWTVHSAAWGMLANLSVTILVSLFTQRRSASPEAIDTRRFLGEFLAPSDGVQKLRSTAWSAVLAWFFLAVGPGLVFGNFAFGAADDVWITGIPSQWAWAMLFWILGLGVIWFLAYRMEMASPLAQAVPPHAPAPTLPPHEDDVRFVERARLRALVLTGAIGFGLAVLIALAFGNTGVPQ
ncbi:MAG: hypothetical protein AAF234_18245 [Pseudomonadota bacterium]